MLVQSVAFLALLLALIKELGTVKLHVTVNLLAFVNCSQFHQLCWLCLTILR